MFLRLPVTSLLFFIFFSTNTIGLVTAAMGSTSFRFTNETDRQALLVIKDLIPGDPLRVFSSWNHSLHFCDWQGVICGRRHQRVRVLNLSSLGLVGSLSPHVGNLTFLRIIDLGDNSFNGKIPQEIGRLFRLQYFVVWNNSFQGEFPTNLTHCPDIRVINVIKNNLRGKLPIEVGLLSSLSSLQLAANHFTGPIPSSFGNLSTLRHLSLAFNNLEGSIPLELGQLLKLEFLQLSQCGLSGFVPTLLYNISSINIFSIAENLLKGSLPPDLGFSLPNLQGLYVGGNQFYGPIPASLANASGLVQIDISTNYFTGPIPINLGTLPDLRVFNAFSFLIGTNGGDELRNFLNSLSNSTKLESLNLGNDHFKGPLPHSIANLSDSLTELVLVQNHITGSIPLGIGNLENLSLLGLSENMLTGSIPDSIGRLTQLRQLYIYTNNISAEIPSSIGNITQLSILALQENMLEGRIPVSLSNCTNLQALDLGDNRLTDMIPAQIFGLSSLSQMLVLSNNYLIGVLPLEVGNLQNLELLDLSENKLSGEIPASLGSCQVLEYLFMEGNFFQSTIPTSFKQLKGIQVLDLSRNNLSGHIPRFLGESTSIQNLNLSYNMFDGEVPNEGVFRNISAFSVVGNKKLCGGIKALQLPACPTKAFKQRKTLFSHRVIIATTTSVIVLLLLCLSMIIYRIRRSSQQASSASPLQSQYPKLSYAELLQATNGFSSANLIGEGRYGSVYKGLLNSNEQIVAVKVLNLQQHGANTSFMAECEALRTIRHRNLVKIITSCSGIDFKGDDFKALVFEFMPNGKYGMGSKISAEGDMYSYGVLLLEMFTGKRPTNMFINNNSLHSYVKMSLPDRVMEIVDPHILLEEEEEQPNRSMQPSSSTTNISKVEACLVSILQIGVSCSAESPSERMDARGVLMELHKIRDVTLGVMAEGRQNRGRNDF
ncbi:leucine-rich repeat protein kinase family protein [Actinidia rufa]|uniref:non-specific serine/threonine protein kinase n=1 Tax=Actinidia rufa TaxID=165716 RepID=A0A7J0DEP5_9ERIC|nr:leucine-rich repeat protein kinase family protein [Actinidia rufa]